MIKLHDNRYKTYKLHLSLNYNKVDNTELFYTVTICVRKDGHLLGILKDDSKPNPSCYLYGSYNKEIGLQFAMFDYEKNYTELEEVFLFSNDYDYIGNFIIHSYFVTKELGDCKAIIEEVTLSKEKEDELKTLIINANEQAKVTIPQSDVDKAVRGPRKFVFFDDDENHPVRLFILNELKKLKLREGDLKRNVFYVDPTDKPN